MEPLEPFAKPSAYRLTRCLTCGCEAHYKLEYTLEKNTEHEATCRACYWRSWAQDSRSGKGIYADTALVASEIPTRHAEENGYDYLGALTEPSLPDDPHLVRCRYCQRRSAARLSDIGWGRSCQVNPNREGKTARPSGTGPKRRALLKDSGLPVLDWWDHEANDPALWETVPPRALREAAWRCPECSLRFTSRVLDMVNSSQCPECAPKRREAWKAQYERYKVTPVADVPELLEAWADDADPRTVPVAGDWQLRRFHCPQGHHPKVSPHTYLESGCPSCRANDTRKKRLAAVEADSEATGLAPELRGQWHPTKNGRIKMAALPAKSRRNVWWHDPNCRHEWQESPEHRQKRQRLRCPECRTVLDSLAFHFPELASEWAAHNPVSAWHVRPSGQTPFLPSWTCPINPEHVWQASLSSRATGSGCPECREHGKSQVELDHHAAAERTFGKASSGPSVRHEAFIRRGAWLVDITVDLPAGKRLAIEYDGAYWHANKVELDLEKSHDLLAAGYILARLREHPLPSLGIDDSSYAEFTVYATAPVPDSTIMQVKHWADSLAATPL